MFVVDMVKWRVEDVPVTLPVVCDGIDNDPPSRPSTGLSISSMASDALNERRVIAALILLFLFSRSPCHSRKSDN